jgi:hypothetical protein
MLGSAFAQALAGVAVAVLQWFWGRKDIRDSERAKIALDGLEQINKALDWKAAHPVVANPDDPFADFLQRKSDSAAPKTHDPGSTGTPRRNPDGSS